MNIVLLSGGSGKRLWPLSNDIRSKQFIKIFKKKDGTYESMVQRVYRQIRKVDMTEQTEHEKCLTNGTYERARESGTEQNYDMIDG